MRLYGLKLLLAIMCAFVLKIMSLLNVPDAVALHMQAQYAETAIRMRQKYSRKNTHVL